ncbi:MAG: helix-turn-helix domain-containing protein [Propionicimonas sp.]
MADVERQLAVVVQRARARWRRLAFAIHPDLQPIGYKILALLVDGGPAPASHLVEELATDKSTVSRQIAQLERLGLVQRTADPQDGRVRLLAATPAAATRLAEVRHSSLADLRAHLASWDSSTIWRPSPVCSLG